jgi:hypothetical protein
MAPQLPVRNAGRQGLKASVQGLGIVVPAIRCAYQLQT